MSNLEGQYVEIIGLQAAQIQSLKESVALLKELLARAGDPLLRLQIEEQKLIIHELERQHIYPPTLLKN